MAASDAPASKRAASSRGGGGGDAGGHDRVSALPDCLLHHIMSMLAVGEAVRTSVLSSRWRGLWATMPVVEIDDETHSGPVPFSRKMEVRDNFTDFMYNYLLLRDRSTLETFRLSLCITCCSEESVRVWLRAVIKFNPRVLDVCALMDDHLDLHDLVFSASRLRTLVLGGVSLDEDFVSQLNSGCPQLEELELAVCCIEFSEIAPRSVKTLKMENCRHDDELVISGPSLERLELLRPNVWITALTSMPSLVKATVVLENITECSDNHRVTHAFLDGLSGVRDLELSGSEVETVLEKDIPRSLMFNNLTNLRLGEWCMGTDSSPAVFFLQRSPVLEKLTLDLNKKKRTKKMRANYKPMETPLSCEHLRMVEIKFSKGDKRVRKLAKMLRANAKCHEKFEILKSRIPDSEMGIYSCIQR